MLLDHLVAALSTNVLLVCFADLEANRRLPWNGSTYLQVCILFWASIYRHYIACWGGQFTALQNLSMSWLLCVQLFVSNIFNIFAKMYNAQTNNQVKSVGAALVNIQISPWHLACYCSGLLHWFTGTHPVRQTKSFFDYVHDNIGLAIAGTYIEMCLYTLRPLMNILS